MIVVDKKVKAVVAPVEPPPPTRKRGLTVGGSKPAPPAASLAPPKDPAESENHSNEKCKFFNWTKSVMVEVPSSEKEGAPTSRGTLESVGVPFPAPLRIEWDPTNTYVAFVYEER